MTFETTTKLLATALLLTVPLIGCIGADGEELLPASLSDTDPGFDGNWTFEPALTYGPDGHPRTPPAELSGPGAPAYVEGLLEGNGAEPTLGVTSTGTILVVNGDATERSRDHGQTWETVHTFETPNHPVTEDFARSADPLLWVDTDTDRVYVVHMHPSSWCNYIAFSDDEGDTWTGRFAHCMTPAVDHPKLITAPPGPLTPEGLLDPVYPNLVYVCSNKVQLGTWCSVSYDGGLTWAYDRMVIPRELNCGNINGFPAAYPDGTIAVPLGVFGDGDGCTRPMSVAISQDNGLTWEVRACAPDVGEVEIDPDITITPDGTAYLLFRDRDQGVYLARSTDQFDSCDIFRVSPSTHTLNVFTAITSGDDGRIAMAYLGTEDLQARHAAPSNASLGSRWHLYVTTSLDADDPEPTFHTVQVTPVEDPVQVGCIWLKGGGGGKDACRNLLDFIDATTTPEGRVALSITDGCVPRTGCTGNPDQAAFQSRDRQVSVVIQASGESLVAAEGLLDVLALERPAPLGPPGA